MEESTRSRLRPEIQALRALAVGAVVMYHLWRNRLPGGYVGVDVFFVISGFLITGQLAREVEESGRVRLGRFWARRAKRLVPASSLVLVATTAGVVAFVPLALWRQFLGEVIAAALQLENWRLAHDSVDYLATSNTRSPVEHFWSLAVEEQFYLAAPLLLLLVALATRRHPGARRRCVVAALGLITIASFRWSVRQTGTSPGVAYFSSLTRAWEFGCGALLATVVTRTPRTRLWNPLPWLGVAGIAACCVAYDDGLAFPGYVAAAPVLATVLAIGTGGHTALARLGAWRPVALAGRVSYAAYLWHLPLLVLLPYATGHELTRIDKLSVLAATAVLSVASTLLLEEPVRFRAALLGGQRPRVVAGWCAAGIVGVVLIAAGGIFEDEQRVVQLATETDQAIADGSRCLGAQAMDPRLAPCTTHRPATQIIPDPANAAQDDANLPGCWDSTHGRPDVCHLGTLKGYHRKLLAIGDSHNNALVGVYHSIGQHRGWRIDVAGMGSCYLTDAVQTEPSSTQVTACREWRDEVLQIARTGGYDAIIVTHSTHNRPVKVPAGSTRQQTTVDGLVSAWRRLPAVPIIAILDNPRPRTDVIACVSKHRSDAATRCAQTRAHAFADPDGTALAVKQVARAHLVDLTAYYCDRTTCPPVIGHVLVYRDGSHVSATYASTLEPYFERQIVAALHR